MVTDDSHDDRIHSIVALTKGSDGLGYRYLNRPSKILSYLSTAAYPIYIVHMIFLYLGAYLIFPMNLNPWVSLLLITVFTFVGCFLSYEILRRIVFLRLLFGLKNKP
jgi:membrane-bound acyltransferase YfiQ involved in biofilm formation